MVIYSRCKSFVDECIQNKEAKQTNVEPCEIELINGSGPSNSSLQRENELADEYVGGNEPHISRSSNGKSSEKTDVFGYGIMLLALITGQKAFDLAKLANDDEIMLLDWVKEGFEREEVGKPCGLRA